MTEILENSPEYKAQKIHGDYRNILRFFVMLAQLESDSEVSAIKSPAGDARSSANVAMEISKIRTRARVRTLADAVYATKHFRSKVEQKIDGNPEGLEAKAYQGLVDARARGDFDAIPNDPRIDQTLRQVPEYETAQREARHALRRDGEAPHDKVQSYHVAAYILTVLPHLPTNPFAKISATTETPPSNDTPAIPRQPLPPLAVDAAA